MAELAIDIEGLSKVYRLGASAGYRTVREALASAVRRPSGHASDREIEALRDLNLKVEEGEALGVIGRNGAGKTTLLKILARITEPTTGVSRTRGRVGAPLEVGTGFHPELTGRENIYLNGSVLGMTRKDIGRRLDEIISFSGLERFLDTPLKRYSAGMRLRLAFAVAAHLESEIVVVDEILATGDAEFQRKCLGRMSELERYGRTIVFVSHDLGSVTRLCSRVVWLDRGSVVEDGRPEVVTRAYLRSGAEAARVEFDPDPRQPVQLRAVAITDADGSALTSPRRDQDLFIRFSIVVRERTPGVDVALDLVNQDGVHVLADALSDIARENDRVGEVGEYEVLAAVPPVLATGDYVLRAWIGTPHETFLEEEVLAFRADPRLGERAEELARSRAAAPAIPWRVSRVTSAPN